MLEHPTNVERTVYDSCYFALEITQKRRGNNEVARPKAGEMS